MFNHAKQVSAGHRGERQFGDRTHFRIPELPQELLPGFLEHFVAAHQASGDKQCQEQFAECDYRGSEQATSQRSAPALRG